MKTATKIAKMAATCVGLALASGMSGPSAAQTTSAAQPTAATPTPSATQTPSAAETAPAAQRAPAAPRDAALVPRTLYVANGGGTLATFAIGPNGAPVLLDTLGNLGMSLRGLVVAPDGRAAYVLDSAAATVSAFALDEEGRPTLIGEPLPTDPNAVVTTACTPDGTLPGPCPTAAAMAPDGRVLYVVNLGANTLAAFAVQRDGSLRAAGSPVATGGLAPRSVAVSPNGQQVYVSHRDSDSIATFTIGRRGIPEPLGAPIQLPGCTPTGDPPQGACAPDWMSITPDGKWLYVVNLASDDLFTFSIGADGALALVAGPLPVGGRPEMIAISADGRRLYIASVDDNAVRAFTIGDDGMLSPLGTFAACEEAAVPAACGVPVTVIAPDGRNVYAATTFRPDQDQLVSFSVEADGTLKELVESPTPTAGDGPLFQGLAIRPNQGPIAALGRQTRIADPTVTFDASTSSDADGRVARYDWDFGDGQQATDIGSTPTHTYATPGAYQATVTVTDDEGCSDAQIFTGQTMLCNGSKRATASQRVVVPPNATAGGR
jgi:6-phosphogluconolactonase (cycloisomerase 2 family)